MWRSVCFWLLLAGVLCTNSAKSFYAWPTNTHYIYYGLSWHPNKVWHSFEYNFQNNLWRFKDFKTVGVNFQFAQGIRLLGLTAEKKLNLGSKNRKIWRYVIPLVGMNPNLLHIKEYTAFNLKPRIGFLLRSSWRFRKSAPHVNLKVCYGLDIPFGNQTMHEYNPNEFTVSLGISFDTKNHHWFPRKKDKKPRAVF